MTEHSTVRRLGLAIVALGALAATPAFAATADDYVGHWMNYDRDSSGITGFSITQTRGGLNIRVMGLCQNQNQPVCDWAPVQGNLYSTQNDRWEDNSWGGNWSGFNWYRDNSWSRDADYVTATFDVGYARKFVVLHREKNNELRVQVFTDSRDNRRGRNGYVSDIRLQKWGRTSRDDRHDWNNN